MQFIIIETRFSTLKTDLRLSGIRHTTTKHRMNAKPISIRDLDINNVTFVLSPGKANRSPSIALKYNGQNLLIRLPRVGFPGGMLVRDNEDGKSTSYTLIASLKGCDSYGKERSVSTDEMNQFYNFLLDLEERIVKEATDNSAKWFNKKKSEEVVRDNFKRILGLSTDKVDGEYVPNGKYPPSFRMKIPVYDNKVNMNIWDDSFNEIYATPESLVSVFPKGVEAKVAVSGSIYIIGGTNFGVTWRLQSAQVYPKARMTARDIFGDDDEEDDSGRIPIAPQDMAEEYPSSTTPQKEATEDAQAPPAPRKARRAVKVENSL